jgi:hypothetical protein
VARYPKRPVPAPLETNATPVVLVGIVLWVVAGLVLLVVGHVPGWWLLTCLAGVVVGGATLGYETWRRRRRRAPASDPRPDTTRVP